MLHGGCARSSGVGVHSRGLFTCPGGGEEGRRPRPGDARSLPPQPVPAARAGRLGNRSRHDTEVFVPPREQRVAVGRL